MQNSTFSRKSIYSGGAGLAKTHIEAPLRTWITFAVTIFVMSLTIWAGVALLDDRQYSFISVLLVAELLLAFFITFEQKGSSARYLALMAVMCAIGVAGRAAFFMIPQFKPTAAVVIITGAALGRGSGFLAGAVTAFASNSLLGHGPWTPWQMVSFGIIGYVSGALFYGYKKYPKGAICLYGFLATLIIYGGIMNPAAVLMVQPHPTVEMIFSSYALGISFDMIHAASTLFFLFVASMPILEKLERIKRKFGL